MIDFGAFILLENDVEGLIHISEVSEKRIKVLSDILSVNDDVNVKIIKITKHDQKIGLSMKHVDQENEDINTRLAEV